jgi:hypothetical protein
LEDVSLNSSDESIQIPAAIAVSTTTFSFDETAEDETLNVTSYRTHEFTRAQMMKKLITFPHNL